LVEKAEYWVEVEIEENGREGASLSQATQRGVGHKRVAIQDRIIAGPLVKMPKKSDCGWRKVLVSQLLPEGGLYDGVEGPV
jgi:hypothetical protein